MSNATDNTMNNHIELSFNEKKVITIPFMECLSMGVKRTKDYCLSYAYPKPEEKYIAAKAHTAIQSAQTMLRAIHYLSDTLLNDLKVLPEEEAKFSSLLTFVGDSMELADQSINKPYNNDENIFDPNQGHMAISMGFRVLQTVGLFQNAFEKTEAIPANIPHLFENMLKFDSIINYAYPDNKYEPDFGHPALQRMFQKELFIRDIIRMTKEQDIIKNDFAVSSFFEIMQDKVTHLIQLVEMAYPNDSFDANLGHKAFQNSKVSIADTVNYIKANAYIFDKYRLDSVVENVETSPYKYQL